MVGGKHSPLPQMLPWDLIQKVIRSPIEGARSKEALLEHHPHIADVHPISCSACRLWGRDSEGRIFCLHRSWWRLGTDTNQEWNLCKERALDTPFLLWYGLKQVGNARCLMNVGLQEQVTHSLCPHPQWHWVPPRALGTLFFAFPVLPAATAQTVVAADVGRALAAPMSLGYLLPGTPVVMFVLLLTALWRSCTC